MKRSRFDAEFRWRCWALGTAASFVALESAALRRGDIPSTLTVVGRGWLGVEPRGRFSVLRLGAFCGSLVWVGAHMATGRLGLYRPRRVTVMPGGAVVIEP